MSVEREHFGTLSVMILSEGIRKVESLFFCKLFNFFFNDCQFGHFDEKQKRLNFETFIIILLN